MGNSQGCDHVQAAIVSLSKYYNTLRVYGKTLKLRGMVEELRDVL